MFPTRVWRRLGHRLRADEGSEGRRTISAGVMSRPGFSVHEHGGISRASAFSSGPGRSDSDPQRVQGVLRLQQTHGNRFVQRAVAAQTVQARRVVGPSDDVYEAEAERAADAVTKMPGGAVQRRGEDEAEKASEMSGLRHPEEAVQARFLSQRQGEAVAPGVEARIQASRGGGRPLHRDVRSFMEPRLGYDFRQVRVHSDARAARMAGDLNAQAFTSGRDIYFAAGKYQPGTASGRHLLAHELTHAAQQGVARPLGRAPAPQRAPSGRIQRFGFAGIKEAIYRGMIAAVRKTKDAAFSVVRTAAHRVLPASLHGFADTLIGICEGVVDLVISLAYAILGLLVGAATAVVGIIQGLIKLAYGIIKYLVFWLQAMFGYPDNLNLFADEILAALRGFIPGLKMLVADWLDRFKKAPPELQTIMIGELTGEILVFIGTFGLAAGKAAQIPKVAIPVPTLGTMTGPGGLAVQAVRVTAVPVAVGEPAVAIGATAVAMSMTGSGGGGGGNGGDDAERFLEEQQRRSGVSDKELEEVSTGGEGRPSSSLGERHGEGGVSPEELGYAARGDRFFGFNLRSKNLSYRGISRAAPGTDEVLIAVGRDGRWRVVGGANLSSSQRALMLRKLRTMLQNIDPNITLVE